MGDAPIEPLSASFEEILHQLNLLSVHAFSASAEIAKLKADKAELVKACRAYIAWTDGVDAPSDLQTIRNRMVAAIKAAET